MEQLESAEPVIITEAMIKSLVETFYGRIQEHAELGPIFNRAIGDNWPEHLLKMRSFWSSITLQTGQYKGNPAVAHMRHKTIQSEHFEMWLDLWTLTALELFTEEEASCFILPAHRMGRNLSQMLFHK